MSASSPAPRGASVPRRCGCRRSTAGTSSLTFRATPRRRKPWLANAARSASRRSSFAPKSPSTPTAGASPTRPSSASAAPTCSSTTPARPRSSPPLTSRPRRRGVPANLSGQRDRRVPEDRALAPKLARQPGAAIVNASSIAALMGVRLLARLHGEQRRAQSAHGRAGALAGTALRVNAMAPGLVEKLWLQKGLGAERYAAAVQDYRAIAVLEAVIAPETSPKRHGSSASRRPRRPARCCFTMPGCA